MLFAAKCSMVIMTMSAIIISYNGVLGNEVVELIEENFKRDVEKSNDIWIVEIYAEYSRKSREFTKVFAEAASKHNGPVKFGRLHSDSQAWLPVRNSLNIRTVPEVKVWDYGKINKEAWKVTNYHGEKTADKISDFANLIK